MTGTSIHFDGLLLFPSFRRMQTMATTSHKPPSMFRVLRTTITEAGIFSLYTGLSASILRQMTYTMVRLGLFDKAKAWLAQHGLASSANLFMASMAAGALGGMAGNPAGVVCRERTMRLAKLNALQTSC